jgi:hypothetical protein
MLSVLSDIKPVLALCGEYKGGLARPHLRPHS